MNIVSLLTNYRHSFDSNGIILNLDSGHITHLIIAVLIEAPERAGRLCFWLVSFIS